LTVHEVMLKVVIIRSQCISSHTHNTIASHSSTHIK
jgi:hypothetical protein